MRALAGLAIITVLLLSSAVSAFADTGFTGGSYDGYSTGVSADFALGGPSVTVSSVANQSFVVGQGSAVISAITITDSTGEAINADNDLRIIIPSGFSMQWDTTQTSAVITSSISFKISPLVTYENSNQTLVLSIIYDFSEGDSFIISGLSFAGFSAASPASNLGIDIYNTGVSYAKDDKTIQIISNEDVLFTGGGYDGYAASGSEDILLNSANTDYFSVTHPSYQAVCGENQTITVTAKDGGGNTITTYSPAVSVSVSKTETGGSLANSAVLSKDSLTASDFTLGVATVTLTDTESETVTLTAVDQAYPSISGTSLPITFIINFTITSPVGGENWGKEISQIITWSYVGAVGSTVQLLLSTDSGLTYPYIITSSTSSGSDGVGSYTWILPAEISSQARVKIVSNDYPAVLDASDADFAITGLQAISPNGGEEWEKGYPHTISWESVGAAANDIVLKYSVDGGAVWKLIDSGQPADGSYPWSVPDDVSATVKIKVYSVSDEAGFYDISDNNFTIETNPKLIITSPNGGQSWYVGNVYNIAWDRVGRLYDIVDLYYSTDGGASWKVIASGQDNSGIYSWTVPDAVGAQVKVRVVESGVPVARDTTVKAEDTSDADLSIIEPSITVTSPDGAEVWVYGDTRNITWTTTGTISNNLLLEYSADGENWIEISSGQANDGIYSWVIPDDPSATVKVRITDSDRPQASDASDGYFNLLSRPRITVSQPNGGELLTIGDSYSIKWNIDGQITSHYVKIEYSKDNFTGDLHTISSYAPNSGQFNWLSVSDDASSTVKIKITDLNSGFSDVMDISDSYFEIRLPSVTVTSPNGGESWYATGIYQISWEKEGDVGDLTLEYSLDNGVNWSVIATGVSADLGAYTWTLPDSLTSQSLLRIRDPARSTTVDTSNTVFNIIAPSLTVISPNGGESWVAGTQHDITWSSIGSNGSVHNNLTLQYSINGGSNWINIATGQANDGSYSWAVADAVSSSCRIRIFDASRSATTDISNADFAIVSPTLTITSPNGAEQWVMGTQHNITWTSIGSISANDLKLEYSTDGGSSWVTIVEGEVNDGSYAWTVASVVSGTCKVRITDTGRTDAPQDASDGVFAILVPQITVASPNGGELWTVGDTEVITWSVIGQLLGSLKIEYSKDNFISDVQPIATVTNTLTSYNWVVPDDVSTTVRIRIMDVERVASVDKSNSDFTILPIPEITLASPNGGESWIIGTEHEITWTDNGGPVSNNLTLEYTIDGSNWMIIAIGQANDGSYSWVVPDNASSTVRVRIADVNRPTTTDVSNNYFIIAVPTIALISPNGGENWAVGDSAPVTWVSVGSVSNELVLYYSVDAGSTWETIATNELNDGKYTWIVPDEPSSLVRLKIVDGVRPATSDTSDANFNIISSPTLTITSPNGGETYVLGDTMNIAWTSKGLSIGLLRIEYSSDNFVTSSIMAQDVSNTGTYSWTIPDTALSGASIKIRITDQARPEITDTSDAVFRIRGGFTIKTPDGGENWGAKSTQEITWSTKGTIANVKIEYSLDSGSTWNTIISSVTNSGIYSWTLPDAQKTTCKVRVSDTSDSTVNAVSARDFNIVYYTIIWKILDYDTYSDLSSLSVSCNSGWLVSDASLVSPVTHSYPYGHYTTFWSRDGYTERSTAWTADADKSVTLYLESTISAQIEWHVYLSTTYTASTDTLNINSWLERRGKMIGLTSTEVDDLKGATLQVFDGDVLIKEMSATTPNSQGVFTFDWTDTGLEPGKTYFIKAQITYRESSYTSGGSVDVTSEKDLYEQELQLQSLQQSLDSNSIKIITAVENQSVKTQEKISEVKTETSQILTAAERTIPAAISAAKEDINVMIASEVTPHVKSSILNTENSIRTGEALTIRYRTFSGLSPTVDVYNADNKQKVNKGSMREIGSTGIYEYYVEFSQNWGKGDFTIICSESTKGVTDALTIRVIETDIEDVYSQVTTILGTTSEIDDLKNVADAMSGQFSVIKNALDSIGSDLLRKAAQGGAVGSRIALRPVFVRLSNLTKQVKQVSDKIGVNLEKIYEVSAEKQGDIVYLKNKTQELKAVMELTKKMVDNIANKPVVQTWYEYKTGL